MLNKELEIPFEFPKKDNGRYNVINQNDFEKIPGSPIGYWLRNPSIFLGKKLSVDYFSGGRNKTHNNVKYVRYFWEVMKNNNEIWMNYSNGGDFKRWYGNEIYVVRWDDNAKKFYESNGGLLNSKFLSKEGITWNLITSAINGFRVKQSESVYSSGYPTIFNNNYKCDYYVLGFLNSKIAQAYLKLLNPTLNTTVGDVLSLPISITNVYFTNRYNNFIYNTNNENIHYLRFFEKNIKSDFFYFNRYKTIKESLIS